MQGAVKGIPGQGVGAEAEEKGEDEGLVDVDDDAELFRHVGVVRGIIGKQVSKVL